jgi:hypothetical protein
MRQLLLFPPPRNIRRERVGRDMDLHLFKPDTNCVDPLSFRDGRLNLRPERPNLCGLCGWLFPAPGREAASNVSNPILFAVYHEVVSGRLLGTRE